MLVLKNMHGTDIFQVNFVSAKHVQMAKNSNFLQVEDGTQYYTCSVLRTTAGWWASPSTTVELSASTLPPSTTLTYESTQRSDNLINCLISDNTRTFHLTTYRVSRLTEASVGVPITNLISGS